MNQNYKNLVFTKHALDRLQDRSISEDAIWQTIARPDKKFKNDGQSVKFIRSVNGRKVHAVATYLKNENKWLVVSVWIRGEDDKQPLVWQLIVLPFKILWWIIKTFFKALSKNK